MCWKWKPPQGYRSQFGPEQVNILKRMVARHYPDPHELVCVTDDPKGIDPDVRIIPLWSDHSELKSAWSAKSPSCYRRLKVFSREAGALIGPRFVSLDLDVVICGDMRPLWNRPEDFVIWGDTARNTPYNGGMFLLRAGTRPQVWEDFNPETSPMATRRLQLVGSDQAWISLTLGGGEKRWSKADGVYSYRNHIQVKAQRNYLPRDARIVLFHGRYDPWMPEVQAKHPWVKSHYR